MMLFRVLKLAIIVSVLILLTSQASACFNPTDSFAFEVLLNKPSISYDLSPLLNAENVAVKTKEVPVGEGNFQYRVVAYRNGTVESNVNKTPQETKTVIDAIIYRSHYNPDVAVIIREVKATFIEGLSVRLQVPTKFVKISYLQTKVDVKSNNPLKIDEELLESLGYEVKEKSEDRGFKAYLRKNNIQISVWSINYGEPESVRSGVHIVILNGTITPELKDELKSVVLSFGVSEEEWNNAKIATRSIETTDLEACKDYLNDFDFKTAIKVELEWLRDSGIISGLSDDDIQRISGLAKAGLAGHNSRIVWENGWKPYYDTSNPMLVRGISCEGFSVENLPTGVVNLQPGGLEYNYGTVVGLVILAACIALILSIKKLRK